MRGPQYHEQRVLVELDLRPLVGIVGVLDGEIVETELLLDPAQHRLVWVVEPKPDELVISGQGPADLIDAEIRHSLAAGVGSAIDDGSRPRERVLVHNEPAAQDTAGMRKKAVRVCKESRRQ